jgi:hypothetical protein
MDNPRAYTDDDSARQVMEEQAALVGADMPSMVLLVRAHYERGQRGFALWVEGAPYQFWPAALIRRLPWEPLDTCLLLERMLEEYDPSKQFILVTVSDNHIRMAVYYYGIWSVPKKVVSSA